MIGLDDEGFFLSFCLYVFFVFVERRFTWRRTQEKAELLLLLLPDEPTDELMILRAETGAEPRPHAV